MFFFLFFWLEVVAGFDVSLIFLSPVNLGFWWFVMT